ncbi:MAG: hypothetical protein AMXMBFR81_18790 [Chthonomonas sp.]
MKMLIGYLALTGLFLQSGGSEDRFLAIGRAFMERIGHASANESFRFHRDEGGVNVNAGLKSVTIHPEDGEVILYTDAAFLPLRLDAPRRDPLWATAEEAKDALTALARKMGVPASWAIQGIAVSHDAAVEGRVVPGAATIHLGERVNGRRFLRGGNNARIQVDPYTGTPFWMSITRNSVTQGSTPTLTESQAAERARAELGPRWARLGLGELPDIRSVELGYSPDRFAWRERARTDLGIRLRPVDCFLAYEVQFHSDKDVFVVIDATSGRVLNLGYSDPLSSSG